MIQDPIIQFRSLTKRYPGVLALEDVSFQIHRGEVHALLGENGAGKSTLIKTLTGAVQPTSGEIVFEGKAFPGVTPALARQLGIGVIYQELNLVPYLNIADNIFLGKELRNGLYLRKSEMHKRATVILNELGVRMDTSVQVGRLAIAYQQLVEIAKAVVEDVKVLILDEPTAPLTNNETEQLFRLIGKLKERGMTIIYISHRMEELFRLSDRITVMRDGRYIDTRETRTADRKTLIQLEVGREVGETYPEKKPAMDRFVLQVRNLSRKGKVDNVSLEVRAGEIVGIGGLVGAGRTEAVRLIFGADRMDSGEIRIDGQKVQIRSPRDAIHHGIGLITEDRKRQGLLLHRSVHENAIFSRMPVISKWGFIRMGQELQMLQEYKESLRIKTPSLEQKVKNLSGGNQQKVVLAKWLACDCKVFIFDEPTRGIDVGAKQEIYEMIKELAEQGKAIIMISSEMPELLGMSDRILVMNQGRIVKELERKEATQEAILEAASSI